MKDTFEFTLNNPLTEEQWDMINDADFDRTDRVTFHTKHGKEVEFIKVIRCMDCKYWSAEIEQTAIPNMRKCTWWRSIGTLPIDFCSRAERRGEDAKRKS